MRLREKYGWVSGALFSVGLMLSAGRCPAMDIVDGPASGVLTIMDGTTHVLAYRFGDQLAEGVDKKYTRSCYVHPLWSVDGGTVLTDDFPKDHPHHHGIFWAWPRVWARGIQTQTWHPSERPLRERFVRWISRTVDDQRASFTVENKWLLDHKEEVAREWVSVSALQRAKGVRLLEFVIGLKAIGGPLKLGGATENNKGYGGFSFRGSPKFKGAQILTSSGPAAKDVIGKRYTWVDLWSGENGLAIFAAPDHPDYPPKWMARNSYAGYVNVSWPGLEPVELQAGESVTLRYGVLVHGHRMTAGELESTYREYVEGM